MPRLALILSAALLSFSVQAANILVEGPWARATAPGQPVGGAFMKLTSDTDVQLTGASSPVAGSVQIHMMSMHNGVMVMRELKSLPLPKGKTVELEPGGYHIMLVDLKRALRAGQHFPITLEVRSGRKIQHIEVRTEVRDMISGDEAQHQ
ncbi:MAG: copper chaperone PCu(A)C [Thiobacillaceae bacterium]